MSDQKRKPVRSVFKYCWYVSAVFIILIAIIIQSARWMTPSINQIKGSIETFASLQLNSEVTIGQVSAKWVGLRPKISIQDLSIQYQSSFLQNQSSNRNKNFLKLKLVSLELHILKSLFYWTPVWRDVKASGISAQLLQGSDGGWSLGGSVVKNNRQERSWRYRRPSSLFLTAQNVTLNDAELTLVFSDKRELISNVPAITIKNNGYFHRLEAKASIANESSFNLIIEGVGDPSVPDKFFAKAYLKLENFAEERLVEWFGHLTSFDIEQQWVHSSSANLELWFDFSSTNRFIMNGHVDLKGVDSVIDAMQAQNDRENGNEWSADIVGGYSPVIGLSVGLRNVYIGESFSVPPFLVSFKDNDKVNIGFESLDLASLKEWVVGRLFRLPFFNTDEFSTLKIKELLTSLNPQGAVNDLYVSVDINEPIKTKLFAKLDQVTTGVWRNVPAFGQVSGYVESDMANGFIVIDAKQFSLFPAKTYDEPIVANVATGTVGWAIKSREKKVSIFGHDLSLIGAYGDAKGHFLLESSWGSTNKKNQLILQLGLKNSKARFHTKLIPRTLPKNLLSWMDLAIKDGELVNTGVFYRGGFAKKSPRSIQVFVDVERGRLKFNTAWPEVNQLNTNLLIDNNRLFAVVNNASAYTDDKFNGEVSWNTDSDNLLNVEIAGLAPADSALQYIRESILKEKVGDAIDQVSAKGNVAVRVALDIPLGKSSTNTESVSILLKQKVDVTFKNVALSFDEKNLSFNAVGGALNYSSVGGFSSKKLQADFFGKPLFIDVYEDPKVPNALMISGKGNVDISSVNEWLSQPILNYLKGDLDYKADIHIPLNIQATTKPFLSIASELVGVSSNLPKPFKKSAEDKLRLDFKLPFTKDKLIYELNVGSYFSTKFTFGDQAAKDKKFSAFFSVSDTVVSDNIKLPKSGVRVLGVFTDFSVDEWIPVFESIPTAEGLKNSNKNNKSIIDTNLFVSINNLRIKDQVFKDIIFSGEREVNGWRVIADNVDLLGSLTIDDDSKKPLRMEFDYLHWPPNYSKTAKATNKANSNGDPLEGVDPSLFPAMTVKVNRLKVLGNSLGAWSFDVLPDKQGVDFRNIYGEVSGFTLTAATGEDGAFLRWKTLDGKKSFSTSVNGSVIGENPKALFEQWDLPVVLEAQKTKIDFNLSWTGSPLAMQLETLTGIMTQRYEDGVFSQDSIDGSSGLLRVFGLLNFNSWARRVRLDFSDIYQKGFTFDELGGELSFNKGLMTLTKPVKMKGPSSEMELSGVIDYPKQTVDAKLEASLPLAGNLTLIAALTAGLPVAAGVYVASKIFNKQIKLVSTIRYTISGDLNNPSVNVEKPKAASEADSIIFSNDNN
jgi:uncharacterized protein (TIGR02099 family)